MPTKRRRQAQPTRADLPPALVEFFFLGDYSATESQAAGLCGRWGIVLDFSPRDCWQIWRQHRETLLAHWREQGVRKKPWAARCYDEQESPQTLPFVSPYSRFRPKEGDA